VRDCVQHFHGGLSGDRLRPVLHRSGGSDDLPSHRKLRHYGRGLRDPLPHPGGPHRGGVQRPALELPLHQDPGGNSGGLRHPRHRGHRHPKAHPQHPRPRLTPGISHRRGHAAGGRSPNHRGHPRAP